MKSNKLQPSRELTEINLTSLVDVSLTLVIIFMVSYPMVMQSGINVAAPAMAQARQAREETEVMASINLPDDDRIELNGTLIAPEQLADSLSSLLAGSREKQVIISAASEVLHDRVVAVLDVAKQSGASQLSIIKTP